MRKRIRFSITKEQSILLRKLILSNIKKLTNKEEQEAKFILSDLDRIDYTFNKKVV